MKKFLPAIIVATITSSASAMSIGPIDFTPPDYDLLTCSIFASPRPAECDPLTETQKKERAATLTIISGNGSSQ